MSAISVIYNLDGRPADRSEIQKSLDSLRHRGDDGSEIRVEANIGLGHLMRWSTPESKLEKLPFKSRESGCVITGDIRIDNRNELIPQLFRGKPHSGISDSEIVLSAYEKWGERMLPNLIGDYVFAIWDPNKRELLCCRDSMGVKHFYYFYRPNKSFHLASEIKGIVCHPDVPCEVNERYVGDVLILNYQSKEDTPYSGIKRLPANNAMIVNENGIRIWQYWRPHIPAYRRPRSKSYYAERFREIFLEAVNCRMRTVGTAGALLSGGLDSSSISAAASKYLDERGSGRLETFSAVFPDIAKIDTRIDERRFIEIMNRHINAVPNLVEADSFTPLIDLDKIQWHADHAIGAPNMFMDWMLFKKANSKGMNVILSGFDGDSTVSYGYEGFEYLARRGRWIRLTRDAVALQRNMPVPRHSLKKLLWNSGFKPATPQFARLFWRILNRRPLNPVEKEELPSSLRFNYLNLNEDFKREHRLKERYFETIAKNHPDCESDAEEHWNSMSSGLFSFALETFEKTAAACSVEPRFPFFDRRLIDFSIGLPPSQRILGGWTRSIFRRAMDGLIPREIQWRTTKANIGLSFKVNLLKLSRDRIEEVVRDSSGALDAYLDKKRLLEAYDRYSDDPIGQDNDAMFLMSAIQMYNWIKNSGEICHPE